MSKTEPIASLADFLKEDDDVGLFGWDTASGARDTSRKNDLGQAFDDYAATIRELHPDDPSKVELKSTSGFQSILEKAGIWEAATTGRENKPVTMFVPTNKALAKYSNAQLDTLEDPQFAKAFAKMHTVPDTVTAEELKTGKFTYSTGLNGTRVRVMPPRNIPKGLVVAPDDSVLILEHEDTKRPIAGARMGRVQRVGNSVMYSVSDALIPISVKGVVDE